MTIREAIDELEKVAAEFGDELQVWRGDSVKGYVAVDYVGVTTQSIPYNIDLVAYVGI